MTNEEAATILVNLACTYAFKDPRSHEAVAMACAALLNNRNLDAAPTAIPASE